ncbi:unnamed protein product [Blepharisma stoltei]|uniref:CTLH domain-containing protein n=1 Tax=Blepharisma stoltei TaxID=1481888 RepID=A0AAU9J7Y6_9CILI|nr:unnamed protein product [Blepharisma stoltei]
MAKLSLSKEETVRLILQYLEANEYHRALIELEKDSKVKLRRYGKEIDFFCNLITDGRFEDAETFITPLKNRSEPSYNKVLYTLRKQRFLEALESATDPKLDDLVGWLKELESVAAREDFSELCHIISLNKIIDHPDYANWNIYRGRINCFNDCLKFLSEIYPISASELPKCSLTELLGQLNSVEILGETGNMRSPKFNSEQNKIRGSFRYSQELNEEKKENASEGSLVINEAENQADREEEAKGNNKKVSFWNIPKVTEEVSDEENKIVYNIEELDVMSPGEDHSLGEDHEEMFRQSSQELMASFNPALLKEMARIEDAKPIRCSAFNVSGDYFVLGTNSNSIKVCSMHNIVDGLMYNEHQGREQYIDIVFELRRAYIGSVYCIDWSRSETQIAAGYSDKNIRVLFCPDFLELQETQSETLMCEEGRYLNGEGELPEIMEVVLQGHQDIVRTVCYNPVDDRILLSGGSNDGDIKVWNTETGQFLQKLQGHNGSIFQIAAEGKASYFISVATDRTLRLWDLRSNKCQMTLNGESFAEMTSVALTNSATQVRAETKDKITNIFLKRQQGKQAAPAKPNLAAVGHADGIVTVWDINAGRLYSKNSYHLAECRSVDFSADTRWLVSSSFDRSIGLVQMDTGSACRLEYHEDRVVSARWHPFLPILLSTSADKTARIFSP